jgi:hypothetical protein
MREPKFSKEPMNALDQAIKACDALQGGLRTFDPELQWLPPKDRAAMVVIKVPDSGDALADQEFEASKP